MTNEFDCVVAAVAVGIEIHKTEVGTSLKGWWETWLLYYGVAIGHEISLSEEETDDCYSWRPQRLAWIADGYG